LPSSGIFGQSQTLTLKRQAVDDAPKIRLAPCFLTIILSNLSSVPFPLLQALLLAALCNKHLARAPSSSFIGLQDGVVIVP
jgi:hypothetical protein